MQNNKGQAMGMVIGILVIVALGAGIWALWTNGFLTGDQTESVIDRQLSSGDCESAPSITVAGINKINKGTTVSVSEKARVNGAYVGSTPSTLQKGDTVELLLNATNFIDTKLAPFQVGCGVNTVPVELYATSTNTFRIFDTNNNLLTDNAAGGATNQSSSSAPISLSVFIDSTSDESTGDLIIVVESTNTTEVDDLKLSGLGGASKVTVPEFYTPNAAGSITKAYKVPQIIDGASVSGTLTVTPESGQTVGSSNSIYVTAYSEQAFVDTDGNFRVGVEDTDGNTKYEDTWDFDFLIV